MYLADAQKIRTAKDLSAFIYEAIADNYFGQAEQAVDYPQKIEDNYEFAKMYYDRAIASWERLGHDASAALHLSCMNAAYELYQLAAQSGNEQQQLVHINYILKTLQSKKIEPIISVIVDDAEREEAAADLETYYDWLETVEPLQSKLKRKRDEYDGDDMPLLKLARIADKKFTSKSMFFASDVSVDDLPTVVSSNNEKPGSKL